MAGEPQNLVLGLLREIRAKLNTHDDRFDAVDKKLESLRQAMIGESVLGRYTVAEVEERLENMEKRITALETGAGKKPPAPRKPTT